MNEITNTNGAITASASLAENEYVKELLGILKDNGKENSGLMALINHVEGMESFVKQAENKIADMKVQLDEIEDIQKHPIRHALKNTIKALETKVAEIKERIAELKANVVEGCKNAVAAFKEKGTIVLDKLASFFRLKPCLQKVKNITYSAEKACDRSIARIEEYSKQYHTAGRAIKNMARIMVGKEPIDAVKESGKLAKAMSAPAHAEKTCMLGIRKRCNSMLGKLEQLNQSAEAKREKAVNAEKPAAAPVRKPTLMERLEKNKELVRQNDLERVVPERGMKPREAAI